LVADTERSIECDPRRTSAGQLELLHALGFHSIGFGVQDLDPEVQRAIGRIQSEELIRDVYWMAREIGFDSISFDLIYGLPQQTATTFSRTLDTVLELAPDRVACFGYARQTLDGPHQHAIDVHELPDNATREQLFRSAVAAFTQAEYAWIGLDTFALETDRLYGDAQRTPCGPWRRRHWRASGHLRTELPRPGHLARSCGFWPHSGAAWSPPIRGRPAAS
jgi:oxygen-independent coproporphyrinogen-3 oxidase